MTGASEWKGRVGDAWAEEWRRTDRALAPLADALLDALAGAPSAAILDVGCGAGTICLALAGALPQARVTGIDLSPALIAVARGRAREVADLRFEAADASSWAPDDGTRFDAIVSRHGLMFFDDPVAAFRHIGALGAPGARFVFSCFRAQADNEWAAALAPLVARFSPAAAAAPPPAKGPFALADRGRIEHILAASGFSAPRIAPVDFDYVAGAGDDAVADAVGLFRRIGPFASMLGELDEAGAAAALEALGAVAASRLAGGRVAFRAAAWIVSTVKPREAA